MKKKTNVSLAPETLVELARRVAAGGGSLSSQIDDAVRVTAKPSPGAVAEKLLDVEESNRRPGERSTTRARFVAILKEST